MPYETEAARARTVRQAVKGAAIAVGAIGVLVLVGWFLDIRILTTVRPGFVSLKANAALAFVASAVALWCVAQEDGGSRRLRSVGLAAAALATVIGGATLLQYALGIDLGIDQLLVRVTDPNELPVDAPGRMAPHTAAGFVLNGLALMLRFGRDWRMPRITNALALSVHILTSVGLVGYLYGVHALHAFGSSTSIAVHASVAFMILSLATIAARPEQGFMRVFVSESAGGVVARAIFPAIFPTFVLLGWLPLKGQELGEFDARVGLAIMVNLGLAVAAAILVRISTALYRVDRARQGAMDELEALNANLERKVRERTASLQQALDEVKQLSGLLPMCAWCKRIRDDRNYWREVGEYIEAHTHAEFTHGICPSCSEAMLRKEGLWDDAGPEEQGGGTTLASS